MKRQTDRAPAHIPEPEAMTLPPKDYQPPKAKLEEEINMPDLSVKRIRAAFFRPLRLQRDK